MNERIKLLAKQAGISILYEYDGYDGHAAVANLADIEKFAELIVQECVKESMDEIVSDEDIAKESDPLIREYLTGQNQGIVDAVIRFRNIFQLI